MHLNKEEFTLFLKQKDLVIEFEKQTKALTKEYSRIGELGNSIYQKDLDMENLNLELNRFQLSEFRYLMINAMKFSLQNQETVFLQ